MGAAAPGQFGRFRVLGELGRGAMGVVYRAEDPALGRPVAIKTITLTGTEEERAHFEARFLQEAHAAGGDSGHIAQNLYLAATAMNLGCCAIAAFFDEEVNQFVGAVGTEETTVYLATVGKRARSRGSL